ncbi:hypothetical protein C5B97_02390 [Pseudoclavibacter sp. RFBB5]|nr:hypothetical protein C5B97_02390 [Pseudoclavibacter sp. RFBB5]
MHPDWSAPHGFLVFAAYLTGFAALVLLRLVYPLLDPVTFTVMFLPLSAAVSLYVLLVAPLIGAPFRSHW